MGGQVEAMQHHHDCGAPSAVQVGEQIEHLNLVGDIKKGRGFAEQHRGFCPN